MVRNDQSKSISFSGVSTEMALIAGFILVLLVQLIFVNPFEVMFDSVSFFNSSGLMELNARVRKINRTTAALNGNTIQTADLDGNFLGMIELHHSPLGNNQFNRYPMKIGPKNFCDFLKTQWEDYYEYFAKYIQNVPKPGECPILARTFLINDWIMDAKMFPPYVPTGLWKLVWTLWDNTTESSVIMEFIIRAHEDGYF